MRRSLATIAAAVIAAGTIAIASPPAFASGTARSETSGPETRVRLADQWAGEIEGTSVYISVFTLSNRRAGAYLADGANVAELVLGRRVGKKIKLRPTEGATVSAIVEGAAVTGTVTIDGVRHEYIAERSTGDGGWYRGRKRARGASISAGFIVLADGSFRGAIRRDGAVVASPNFDPSDLTLDLPTGETIEVLPVAAFVEREQRLA